MKADERCEKILIASAVEMEFNSMKKVYTPPILKELTEEQAKKLVADRKQCSEEEAAQFLKPPRKGQQKNDAADQQRKRSA